MKKLGLNEDFICRIWEDNTNYRDLTTCSGESISVIDPGKRNYDAGPDYRDAKIKIGNIIYNGSIEVHRSADDWYLHNHQGDNKYNDVILHVAFYGSHSGNKDNPRVKRSRVIPTVILSGFLTRSIHNIWKDIINNPLPSFKLPCYPKNLSLDHSVKKLWMSDLGYERLIFKTGRLRSELEEISSDIKKKIYWEQILFKFICEALGFSKNKEQFLKLAGNICLNELKMRKLKLIETDSLLFGLSGFLSGLRFKDDYIKDLKANWSNLKFIMMKESMDMSEWNFFRLRPPNFPTLRIAFASGLLYDILHNEFLKDIIDIFENGINIKKDLMIRFRKIKTSDYWNVHYNFGKAASKNISVIGIERISDITINVLLPVVYLYSELFNNPNLKKRVEYFYKKEKQKSSSNEVIRMMERQLDVKVNTISDEQALLHLHNNYCIRNKCRDCNIGNLVFTEDIVKEPLKIILY